MRLSPPSLATALSTALLFHRDHAVLAVASSFSSSPLQCRSGWTNEHRTVPSSQINDGYCDCPDSGADEPETGACAGSMDGMWTGASGRPPTDDRMYFVCPQQPTLKLPVSRVDDGICDCCDGADEPRSANTAHACPDMCDELLAEEQAARAKAQRDYALGSAARSEALSAYRQWHAEKTEELRGEERRLAGAEEELRGVEAGFAQAKVAWAKHWLRAHRDVVGGPPLWELVGGFATAEDLARFVVALCRSSAEVAATEEAADRRCVALERASLDLGLLWHPPADDDGKTPPSFDYVDIDTETSLVDFADRILHQLEGQDAVGKEKTQAGSQKRRKRRSDESSGDDSSEDHHFSGDDSSDDPYRDDWEDHYDADEMGDEMGDEVGERSVDVDEEPGETQGERTQPTPHQLLVKSLLDAVPLDRSSFKEQSKRLLSALSEDVAVKNEGAEDSPPEDESSADGNNDGKEAEEANAAATDRAALKSTLSRHLSNISRGEASAKSAARYVAAAMAVDGDGVADLRDLAVMVMYHSQLSAGDVAELVYATSSALRSPPEEKADGGAESSCALPWHGSDGSGMCPSPRTVPVPGGHGGRTYPPAFVVNAARRRCEERERNLGNGDCASGVLEAGATTLPSTIPDGYYNYFVPQFRASGADANGNEDEIRLSFSSIDAMHERMSPHLSQLSLQKDTIEKTKRLSMNRVTALKQEIGADSGGGSSKYGRDGELYLYALHDTSYKITSGKYEYEITIWGKATQRDGSGETHLGQWEDMDAGGDGRPRVMKWGGGTRCYNGPTRSAEVSVTCGAETRLLTADEPETCQYVFTMESPIGCDEHVRLPAQ